MADQKYAALPGIAYDQPDFYESEDVDIESDSNLLNQDHGDCIEKLSTNVAESFTKFQGCWLSSQKADFSGKVGVKHNIGYSSWNGPYELQAVGEKESPIQKLNRLKCEVVELQQEIESTFQNSPNLSDTNSLVTQVSILQHQLMEIKVQEVGFPITEQSSKRKMIDELERAARTTVTPNSEDLSSSSNLSNIVYQLQYKPNKIKFDVASKEADLVHRLEKLECLFGANSEKMNQLCAETGQKSIADAVRSINSKVALLEPSHVDQVEARLGVLMQKLNSIASKHMSIDDVERSEKVKELYELVKLLEPLISLLPSIVERLSSLKVLHDGAVNFSQTLSQVENQQTKLVQAIQSQLQLLTDVQQGLSTNVQAVTSAVQTLEQQLPK